MSACRTMSAALPEPSCGLRLTGLSKEYDARRVVDGVSLTVAAGEVFGLLGPNGAGKTTVMKMIAGLTRPSAGSVRVFGLDVAAGGPAVKRLVGLVPQDNNMERELTVEESLAVYGRLFAVPDLGRRLEETLTAFSLHDIRHKTIGLLSGGMARRALIARALLPGPELLLLDEPTVGLDPDVRRDIWDIVRRLAGEGRTVVLTTHYMEEAEKLCRRVAMLRAGRLALLDTPEGIRERAGDRDSAAAALETVFIQLARAGGA